MAVPPAPPDDPHAPYRRAKAFFDKWREHLWALSAIVAEESPMLVLPPSVMAEQEKVAAQAQWIANQPFRDWLHEELVKLWDAGELSKIKLHDLVFDGDNKPKFYGAPTGGTGNAIAEHMRALGMEKYASNGLKRWRFSYNWNPNDYNFRSR